MTASGSRRETTSRTGWDSRLYWQWIAYNTVAFVIVLTAGFLLALLGDNALHLEVSSHHVVIALLIATLGAALFGGVLGALQWLVVRQRVAVPRKVWITANVGPALLAWLLVIMPAVISAQDTNNDVSTASWPRVRAWPSAPCSVSPSHSSCARSLAAGPGGSARTWPHGSSWTPSSTCCHG